MTESEPEDAVAWVRRVNGRWLARPALKAAASAYLEHLASIDPARLDRSCRLARLLAERHGPAEDPKPWFYAGLFSLATVEEGRRFLAAHAFTRAAVPALAAADPDALDPATLSAKTWEKVLRIRRSIALALEGTGRS